MAEKKSKAVARDSWPPPSTQKKEFIEDGWPGTPPQYDPNSEWGRLAQSMKREQKQAGGESEKKTPKPSQRDRSPPPPPPKPSCHT